MLLGLKEKGSLMCWGGRKDFLEMGVKCWNFEMQNGGKVRSQERDMKVCI